MSVLLYYIYSLHIFFVSGANKDINDKERKEIMTFIKNGVNTEVTPTPDQSEDTRLREKKLRKYKDLISHLQRFQDRLREFKDSGKEIIKLIDKKALM